MLLNFSDQLFKRMLVVFPKAYRLRFLDEMSEDFRELSRDIYREKGLRGFLSLWLWVGIDILKSAFDIHIKTIKTPTMKKMVLWGVVSASFNGAFYFIIAFTHASPNWIDWSFWFKWIWLLLGIANLMTLLGLVAFLELLKQGYGAGLYIAVLGATMMSMVGPFMMFSIKVWPIFMIGSDILAIGMLIEGLIQIKSKGSRRWMVAYLLLGIINVTANQFSPARNLGRLFEWDGTTIFSLTGIAWILLGIVLYLDWNQKKHIINSRSVRNENENDILDNPDFSPVVRFLQRSNRIGKGFGLYRRRMDYHQE